MKEYKEEIEFNSISLTKQDLHEFITIIEKDFRKRGCEFELRTNEEKCIFVEKSLKDFFKQPLPEKLSDLQIRARKKAKEGNSSLIHMWFTRWGVRGIVTGKDQQWVIGKSAQIKDFLKKREPKLSLFHEHTVAEFIWEISAITAIIIGIIQLFSEQLPTYISAGILIAGLAAKYLYNKYEEGALFPRLSLFTVEKTRWFDNKDTLIAVIALVLTLIGSVIIPLLMILLKQY